MDFEPPRDRFEFWVRFAFGAVFGPTLAVLLCCSAFPELALTWLVALLAAVIFGLLAAVWGDRFWHFFLGLFRWW